jgi:hypothetical protein
MSPGDVHPDFAEFFRAASLAQPSGTFLGAFERLDMRVETQRPPLSDDSLEWHTNSQRITSRSFLPKCKISKRLSKVTFSNIGRLSATATMIRSGVHGCIGA